MEWKLLMISLRPITLPLECSCIRMVRSVHILVHKQNLTNCIQCIEMCIRMVYTQKHAYTVNKWGHRNYKNKTWSANDYKSRFYSKEVNVNMQRLAVVFNMSSVCSWIPVYARRCHLILFQFNCNTEKPNVLNPA